MNAVTCAIAESSTEKRPVERHQPVGNFPVGADSFPRHVLVIDDEPLIRWSVSETLSDLGYTVAQAHDAAEALRTVTGSGRPFDVVVLDLRLPDTRDLSLVETLRTLLPGAMLILMTAFGTPEIISDARALGATILNKPFELDDLKRLVSGPGTEAR